MTPAPSIAPPKLYLASSSPRRAQLLAQIGVQFEVAPIDVAEVRASGERALDYVCRLARDKALAGWRQLGEATDALVLGADTLGVIPATQQLAEQLLEKPRDAADAKRMLQALSGRAHWVYTAVALASSAGLASRLVASQVHFRQITEDETDRYWQTGEPCDKAGGYAIQGFGAVFVSHLEGSYSAVMGLPLCETAELLSAAGLTPWQVLSPPFPSRS